MSSVNRKFNGLKTHSTKLYKAEAYKGSECLYHSHGASESSVTWRDGVTHACLECCQSILQHNFGLDIQRLTPKAQKKAYSFWEKVEIGGINDCWRWKGKLIANSLYFAWERRDIRNLFRFHPILVSVWLSWGDVARLGTVSTCGNRRCCNPLHNLPLGLIEKSDVALIDHSKAESEIQLLKEQLKQKASDDYLKDISDKTSSKEAAVNNEVSLNSELFASKIHKANLQLRARYMKHMN